MRLVWRKIWGICFEKWGAKNETRRSERDKHILRYERREGVGKLKRTKKIFGDARVSPNNKGREQSCPTENGKKKRDVSRTRSVVRSTGCDAKPPQINQTKKEINYGRR